MYEKFGEESIKVIMLAQEEVRRLSHADLSPEFVLAAIVLEGRGIAAKSLKSAGVNREKIRTELENAVGKGSHACSVEIPLTPDCKTILESAMKKRDEFGDPEVYSEHILLSIVDEEDKQCLQMLRNLGVDIEWLAKDILDLRERREEALRQSIPAVFKQGDVILVLLESMQETGKVVNKRRPMIVVSNDEHNLRLKNVTVVPLTARTRDFMRDPLDILITANSDEGKAGGLRQDSIVACTFVYTYPKSWVVAKIGALPQNLTDEICSRVCNLVRGQS